MFLFDSPNTAAGTHVGERMAEAPRAGSDWLIGGGEMGKLIRSKDWSQTPLGPIGSWPEKAARPTRPDDVKSLCHKPVLPEGAAFRP